VFCRPCAVLLGDNRKDKDVLVNLPFSKWVKFSETLSKHAKLAYYHDFIQAANILKTSVENPSSRIYVMTDQAENMHIFFQIVHAITFLYKQGLPLQGDIETVA